MMARVYIPGGSTYQNVTPPMKTVTEQVQVGTKPASTFFGIPIGSKPVYQSVTKDVPAYTATSNYGANNTGRTTPGNPSPTMPDYLSTSGYSQGDVSWAGGGNRSSGGNASAQASPFAGLLARLFGVKTETANAPYEAALRERPLDIQNLVSMTQRAGWGEKK